jgi:hypothetical protein
VQIGSFEIGGVVLTEMKRRILKSPVFESANLTLAIARSRSKPNTFCRGFDRKACTGAVARAGALS